MHAQTSARRPASGNVRRVKRKRGDQWYIQARLPDGQQIQKRLGPAWSGNGRPPAGYFTKRTAQTALRQFLTDADRGVLPEIGRRGDAVTVEDAANEWLRYVEHERTVKPATLADYKSAVKTHIIPAFGDRRIEQVTKRSVETWQTQLAGGNLSPRTRNKLLTILGGIFGRAQSVWGVDNPVAGVEHPREQYSGDIEIFSPEEVYALARAAQTEQDAAVFLTAAFSGLRQGELIALRWRDVDFANRTIRVRASLSHGVLTVPKGGRVRSVPMVKPVAETLARLSQRGNLTAEEDLVFPGIGSWKKVEAVMEAEEYSEEQDEVLVGDYLDRSALRRRFVKAREKAGLRPLRFHDLRHTFGSLAINEGSPVEVQAWMGHSDLKTTMRYLHYRRRDDEAERLSRAFEAGQPETQLERALQEPVEGAG